jgi:hypothetical protein
MSTFIQTGLGDLSDMDQNSFAAPLPAALVNVDGGAHGS